MRFRTEIENLKARHIDADDRIVLLGSCFADNIGQRLTRHGFSTIVNPLGPLFNPVSLADAVARALEHRPFDISDLTLQDGVWHCLDASAAYCSEEAEQLLAALNRDFKPLTDVLTAGGCTLFATFGTSFVYRLRQKQKIVANCHRFPACAFERQRMSVEDIVTIWGPLLERLQQREIRVIFTVSPVRHVADGLHANNLSKATLHLAVDTLGAEYFPAYEIVCDDLRDYRFYGSDLKHPSEQAIDYIYEKFADAYFSPATKQTAERRYAEYLRAAHRPHQSIL